MTSATIVMYHVVQPAGAGILGQLKGRTGREFAEQIAYIKRHYSPVRLIDFADAAAGKAVLPPKPIALTFDDGYASHARVVAPVLAAAEIPATFFPVASALIDRAVLNVNKIQCILASAEIGMLVSKVDAAIARDPGGAPAEYRERWFNASRWDPPEVVYVKHLLQHALPETIRKPLIDDLFVTLVTADERALADQLYMTVDEARQLQRGGFTIGAHADRHVRLPTLSREGQAKEIDGAMRVFDAIGVSKTGFAYSYANGEFNDISVELLRARGCSVAVSTHPELAVVSNETMLALPRLDTNDLPVDGSAEPNEWTRRASAAQNAS